MNSRLTKQSQSMCFGGKYMYIVEISFTKMLEGKVIQSKSIFTGKQWKSLLNFELWKSCITFPSGSPFTWINT